MKPAANFLITSHTSGSRQQLKESILCGLIKSIRRYFTAFIVLASASPIPEEAKQLVDSWSADGEGHGYHGNQEKELLVKGLSVLKQNGKDLHYRIVYDFIIDDSNIQSLLKMAGHGDKDFVCAWDDDSQLAIRSNIWYGGVAYTLDIIENARVNYHMESAIFHSLKDNGGNVYFHQSIESMFDNSEHTYDLIQCGGTSFVDKKINYFLSGGQSAKHYEQ